MRPAGARHHLKHQQQHMDYGAATAAPATLDDLTNTLDYTFIDLPDLVEWTEDEQDDTARQQCPQAAQAMVQASQYQLQQPQVQQQLGAFQQYLTLPYYQQLQQGAQQAAQRPPELGPLGQAFLSAQQQTTAPAQQPHTAFTQQPQQHSQQPWTAAGAACSTLQQQQVHQHAVQQGQCMQHVGSSTAGAQVQQAAQAAQPPAQAAAADMDEG